MTMMMTTHKEYCTR